MSFQFLHEFSIFIWLRDLSIFIFDDIDILSCLSRKCFFKIDNNFVLIVLVCCCVWKMNFLIIMIFWIIIASPYLVTVSTRIVEHNVSFFTVFHWLGVNMLTASVASTVLICGSYFVRTSTINMLCNVIFLKGYSFVCGL